MNKPHKPHKPNKPQSTPTTPKRVGLRGSSVATRYELDAEDREKVSKIIDPSVRMPDKPEATRFTPRRVITESLRKRTMRDTAGRQLTHDVVVGLMAGTCRDFLTRKYPDFDQDIMSVRCWNACALYLKTMFDAVDRSTITLRKPRRDGQVMFDASVRLWSCSVRLIFLDPKKPDNVLKILRHHDALPYMILKTAATVAKENGRAFAARKRNWD